MSDKKIPQWQHFGALMKLTEKDGKVSSRTFSLEEADALFIGLVFAELQNAREKFPDPNLSMTALIEEVGELAQAMLKYATGKWPWDNVMNEAAQVAAMALRVAIEGDISITQSGYVEPGDLNTDPPTRADAGIPPRGRRVEF